MPFVAGTSPYWISTGFFPKCFERFDVHVDNFLWDLVMGYYVEGCYGESSVEEGLKLRKYLIWNVGKFNKLFGMLADQRVLKSCE